MENNKQETLEEVAKTKYPHQALVKVEITDKIREAFVKGAKWQQEQDKNKYSEEEVYNLTQQLRLKLKSGVLKWQDDFEFDLFSISF